MARELIKLPNGTPIGAIRAQGDWSVSDPPGYAAGTYTVEVQNTVDALNRRVVKQTITNMQTGDITFAIHTVAGTIEGTVGGFEIPPDGVPGVSFLGLSDSGTDIEWRTPSGSGDMVAAIYDPTGVEDDAFDLANMNGELPAEQVSGLHIVATSGSYDDLEDLPTLGTAAALNVGTAAGNVVQVNPDGRLPSIDGSLLTNLPGGMSATTYDPQEIAGDAFDLTTHTGVLPLSKGGTGVNAANEAALRAALGLAIGVNVQAYSAILAATTGIFTLDMQNQLNAVDLIQLQEDVNSLTSGIQLIGLWDASEGTFPGSDLAQPGYVYVVSTPGTVDGVEFFENDRIMALVPNASSTTYGANWHRLAYTDTVISVAGKTGVVTLVAADITDLGTLATFSSIDNSLWSGEDLSILNGGTGASDAATARENLGVEIGVDVQAYNAALTGTQEAFLTEHKTKLDLLTITNPIDLDELDIDALLDAIADIEEALDAVGGVVSLRGLWDAAAGTFPGGGTAIAGYTWIVEQAGTVDGVSFNVNDQIIAIADNASTTTYAGNWHKQDFTGDVISVAGKTGAVELVPADITGLGALASKSTINNADWSGTVLAVGNGGTGSTNAAGARTNLGIDIGVNVQGYSARLQSLSSTYPAGSFIRSIGAAGFEARTPTQARGDLGLGDISVLDSVDNANWGVTDLAIVNGGTGASTAFNARANLGLAIGTNVQAYSAILASIAGANVSANRFLIANGTTFVSTSLADTKTLLLADIPEALVPEGGQTITGGFDTTPHNAGTFSSGTFTPDLHDGNLQEITNNGAFVFDPPTGSGPMAIKMTNGASAGTPDFGNFDYVFGADDLTTVNGAVFFIHIMKIGSTSRVTVEALE